MLYNILFYITCDVIERVMLCYIRCVMLLDKICYNTCHVMLYYIRYVITCHVMLYNMCHVII